jgi:hypothetical protein
MRQLSASILRTVRLIVFSACLASTQSACAKPRQELTPDDVFQTTSIWEVHLTFTPEQWQAMEPKHGPPSGVALLGPEGGRNGLMAAAGLQFEYVHADLTFDEHTFKNVGVRYKGNGTYRRAQGALKRPLKLHFNRFEKGQTLAGISQLNLHTSVHDPGGVNEPIAYRLYRDGGLPAPRTAYAKVFITVPEQYDRRYLGLYTLVEDVGHRMMEEQLGVKHGALFKPVTPHLFADLGDDWKAYNQIYDPKGEIAEEQKKRVIEFCKFARTADDATFAAKFSEYIDVENFARYMAITTWLCDFDGILGFGQNHYVYLHPTTGKFMFLPWDQDQSFGQFVHRESDPVKRENLSIHKPWYGKKPFLERAFNVASFKREYLAKLREFNETILKPERLAQHVDEIARVVAPVIREESPERFAEMNKAVSGEWMTKAIWGSRPTQVKPIKPFAECRHESVSRQLAGKLKGYIPATDFTAEPLDSRIVPKLEMFRVPSLA